MTLLILVVPFADSNKNHAFYFTFESLLGLGLGLLDERSDKGGEKL